MQRVLITGGAGFIGSHVADDLLARGYEVRALDALVPQVHEQRQRPAHLAREVELIVGDVRDPDTVRRAVDGCDAVIHLAARVGVGQSMYELAEYTAVNTQGTAVLLEALIAHPVRRLVVASSMSIYGEGLYRAANEAVHDRVERTVDQLARGDWDPRDRDGEPLVPWPTPESKPPSLASAYALTKYDQERLCLLVGNAYRLPTVALRFFNVYGPRQALANPYTGALAIFAARYLNKRAPLLFEDGWQQRDFVHVRDVAHACRLALEGDGVTGRAYNIASGRAITIREVAQRIGHALGLAIAPELPGTYRVGDIRHCIADIGLARRELGYAPATSFDDGLEELVGWIADAIPTDRVDQMRDELVRRGLAR